MPVDRDIDRLIHLVRQSFNRLRAVADGLHADLGMNASLRAVLEALEAGGEQTVPQIARAKMVSRQHIQKIVDALLAGGHVVARSNPGHKRSSLIALAAKGRAAFAAMQRREAALIRALSAELGEKDLAAALRTLDALDRTLSTQMKGKTDHDDN